MAAGLAKEMEMEMWPQGSTTEPWHNGHSLTAACPQGTKHVGHQWVLLIDNN